VEGLKSPLRIDNKRFFKCVAPLKSTSGSFWTYFIFNLPYLKTSAMKGHIQLFNFPALSFPPATQPSFEKNPQKSESFSNVWYE
jgi:hypothetical protein